MKKNEITAIFSKIGKIYLNIVKRIGSLLAFLAAALGIASIIVLPIWYMAGNFRRLYTIIVLAAICGTIIFFVIRRTVYNRGTRYDYEKSRFLRFFWRLGAVLVFIGWIYSILILILRGMFVPAVFLIIAFLIAFGFFLYAKNKADNKT